MCVCVCARVCVCVHVRVTICVCVVCVCVCVRMCVCGGGGFVSATSSLVNPGNTLSIGHCGKCRQLPLCVVWSSPDYRDSKLTLNLQIEVKYILHEEMTREKEQGSATLGQNSNRHSSRQKQTSKRNIVAATWNIRTLIESAGGDKRISRSRPQPIEDGTTINSEGTNQHLVDRKSDHLVSELRRYGVSVWQFRKPSGLGRLYGRLTDTHSSTLAAHCQRMKNQQLGMRGLLFSWTRGQRQLGRRLGKSGMLSALV